MSMDVSAIESAIAVFESFLEIRLPKEYKVHLLNHKARRLEPACFNFADGTQVSRVHHLHKLNSKNTYDDLVKNYKVFSGRIPSDYLSIADDPSGNQICLAVKGKDYGKVFFWDHEFEHDEEGPPSKSNMSLIANTFEAFLDSLFSIQT